MHALCSNPIRFLFLGLSLAILVGWLHGCSDAPASSSSAPGDTPRIASLSPALTTMAIDLGMADSIVGRTPYCRGIDRPVPVVGSLDEVDAELLLQVAPDILLVQHSAAGMSPGLRALAEQLDCTVVEGRLDSLDELDAAVHRFAEACDRSDVRVAAQAWRAECADIRSRGGAENGPRVLLLYSVDPFGAAGRDTYLDELLGVAGGRNAIARSGWLEVSAEELLTLEPEVVMVFGSETGPLDRLGWLAPPRIELIAEPDALEPSTRMPAVARRLRTALEGDG